MRPPRPVYGRLRPYMLNTRNEEKKTVFYSYLACFVNTSTSNMLGIHAIYRVNQEEYVIHIRLVAPSKYANMYSTLRPTTLDRRPSVSISIYI